MDHTDDFTTNWRIQSEDDKPLDELSIESFIAEHGTEQAIGYMRAVRDFTNAIEFAIFDIRSENSMRNRPLTRIKNNAIKLLVHNEIFLEAVTQKGLLKPKQNPD